VEQFGDRILRNDGLEIEAKIALSPGEIDQIERKLIDVSAVRGPMDHEHNYLYDFDDGSIHNAHRTLRIRRFDQEAAARLTYKGPRDPRARYKARHEVEVDVGDGVALGSIFEALGLEVTAYYEKQRQNWRLGDVLITLDRLLAGDFIEIEGSERNIDGVLALLGLSDRPVVREGYATLTNRLPRRVGATSKNGKRTPGSSRAAASGKSGRRRG
jgi:adenylate cyclase class 2